ncbi:hypothetical protein ASPSYDRAFT_61033 [Aspergillus sydowii CBS 593.65]|uniref:Uncharacterized protein n=1 Tax=Aspergillus sydowii CBS 593.65 TaxID=1036612 RepID=A0A1L9T4P3_9EURO|nr:uncharacterized protein ASPSYDRAFT_61033 [Aspergillus sydowii CBS 593.65]OJJ54404.1 hypothetical protein ASPSYDRAFT_61033 [Aspergillus sydowii CBS 593.65]
MLHLGSSSAADLIDGGAEHPMAQIRDRRNETSHQHVGRKVTCPDNGQYDAEDCQAAIQGSRIPKTFEEEVHRLCTIRGIRHHYGFAQELYGVSFDFTRALNARDIMSGIIPTMLTPEEVPYCFWYPDIPTEETLRALVQTYPDIVYQVARACAVGGYFNLYKVLPEVHIAEEAGYTAAQRKSKGSQEIYSLIISQPVKFEIMNDYTCTVNTAGCRVAFLNGDTAPYSSLTVRTKYSGPRDITRAHMPWTVYHTEPHYFNIIEDWGIDDHDCEGLNPKPPEDYFPLVYTSLPADLPFIDKDKLIKVAAYNGEIDRYARLRRPQMLEDEWAMVVHGIYHNPTFAKWWSTQIPEHPQQRHEIKIRRAINARRIISNNLTWLTMDTPGELLPELIWYPNKLAHKRPDMFEDCLRACIVANYTWTWDDLLRAAPELLKGEKMYPLDPSVPEPEDPKLWWLSKHVGCGLWREAKASSNKQFQNDICAAVPDAAEKFRTPHVNSDWWGDYYMASDLYSPQKRSPVVKLHDPVQPGAREEGPYNGMDCGVGDVDIVLFLDCAVSRETWKREILDKGSLTVSLEEVFDLLGMEQTK